MNKHPHHDVITLWVSNQTLELEHRHPGETEWFDAAGYFNPLSHPGLEWRIKPALVRIGRHRWPVPLSVAPEIGEVYWFVSDGVAIPERWENDSNDRNKLNAGVVHNNEAAARQHAKAMVYINRGDIK